MLPPWADLSPGVVFHAGGMSATPGTIPSGALNPGTLPVGRGVRGQLLLGKVEQNRNLSPGLPDTPRGEKVGKDMPARSARTGRFVTKSAAARSPRTTVVSSSGKAAGGKRNRSAITGRFVTNATVLRHPENTIVEGGKK